MAGTGYFHYYLQELQKEFSSAEAAAMADIVWKEVTGLSRLQRITQDIILSAKQKIKLDQYLQELLQHKPVQYVIGKTWFYNMPFIVNENVLIPRPETEELVEWILQDGKKLMFSSSPQLLDMGAGSGCIAIALKKNLPDALVQAIDISSKALEVAQNNAAQNNITISFLLADILNESTWKSLGQYDIIVSNPPYVKQSEKEEMEKNVVAWEPHQALFVPDKNALIFYEAIAGFASRHLSKKGWVYVEINESLGAAVVNLFREKNFKNVQLKKDISGKDRMIRAGY